MIKISGKVDKPNTDNGLNISFLLYTELHQNDSDEVLFPIKSINIESIVCVWFIHLFLSSCQIYQNLPFLHIYIYIYIYIYIWFYYRHCLQII